MMKQYLDVKDEYDDYIVLYRLGDFYECFFEDAVTVSKELELTLTARDCGNGKRAAMCGVPYHKLDLYLGRLAERGFKVAICEQTEDPKAAEGLVKREVVRVVTPGTITDSTILNESQNNYLVGICMAKESIGLAFVDVSTGEISATNLVGDDRLARAKSEIGAYQPAEAIINKAGDDYIELSVFMRERFGTIITDNAKRLYEYDKCRDNVNRAFGDDAGKLNTPELIVAVGVVLSYIEETQKIANAHTKEIRVYSKEEYLELDLNTRRNLELVESMRNKEKRGSLLWVLDKTKTSMGARLLRTWILRPLIDPVAIGNRQNAVSEILKNQRAADELAELLSGVLDLERLVARAIYGSANAKDLRAICNSILVLPEIKSIISSFGGNAFNNIIKNLDTLDDISEILDRAIDDNPPFQVREGGIIKDGYDADVDYYRSILTNGENIMRSIEEREREATGIKTLKVSKNSVFGYFIEVTKSFVNEVPDRFIRKQTLTNCERYITEELKNMETEIFNAGDRLVTVEYNIFQSLRQLIADNGERIRKTASLISEIDVYRAFADVAKKNSYSCPDVDLSTDIIIKDGRHPIVEKFVRDSYFVPNDTTLDLSSNKVMIITGPNMAGKSTYMRQVAIITLMAQIGSFVPARSAKIGIVDKIFTRVGASDDLASGQSTFMLEMNEVAAILKNATKRSLIIYDEVGRGTSTFDGMSIARAVVEYTYSKKIGAKTLFATHYHELIDMEDKFPGIVNYNIAAKKRGDSITFLRKIVRGGTDDSYGIEVAKLAGVPSEVVKRAKEILSDIESGTSKTVVIKKTEEPVFDIFSSVTASKDSEVADKLRATDLNTLTPIEAMNLLFELKAILKD
jgi:DNA mismatch repair protein MutS